MSISVCSSAAPCRGARTTQPMVARHPNTKFTSEFRPATKKLVTNGFRFMDLSLAEVSYFIEQVAMSAASFGVAQSDLMVVGTALMNAFGYRCEAPITIIPAQGPQLQSICIDDTCPLAPNSTCASYNATMKPAIANSTLVPNATASASGSSTSGAATSTGSMPATVSTAAGATYGMSFAAVAGGLAALFL